jgi:hypothetical protein
MAKVTSPFTCSGSIGHTVFSLRNGTTVAYLKPALDREKWRNNPKAQLSHLYAQQFGGAATYACAIYRTLKGTRTRGLVKPYAHNHIASRIRRHVHTAKGFPSRLDFHDAVHALQGLDLSRKDAPKTQITFLPVGPRHCPTHVRVQGIRDAARTIDPTASRNLEFRVTRKNIRFPEINYNPLTWGWTHAPHSRNHLADSHPTLWIPVDCVPGEGIRLPLHTNAAHTEPDNPEACFFILEWRELKPRQKPKKLKDHAVIRVAAIRASAQQAQDLPLNLTSTERKRHYKGKPTQARRKNIKKANPSLYLRIALNTG